MNSMITILIVMCYLSQFIAFINSDVCRSQDGNLKCCPGFVWNIKENKCKQCDTGTIGPHCEIVCPYPWYGKQCLSKCNCSKDHCDTANGCIVWTTQDSLAGHSATLSRAEGFNECDAGTIGPQCEIVCPYPWYGKQCLSKCLCSEEHCDPAAGCIEWTTQVLLAIHTSTVSRSDGFNEIGMGTLTTVPFETENADESTDTQISYKWLIVTTVPLCVIFGIIIVALMLKHLRHRREIGTIDAAYTVPTHQNVRHIYDLCDEGHHQENPKRENGQEQENTKDAAYTAPTHQNVRHIYDLCDESLHPENQKRENNQNLLNVSNTITDDDGYLTVVDKKDSE